MTLAVVEQAFQPIRYPEEFVKAIEAGAVRSYTVVWIETPDAGGLMRYSTDNARVDKPLMVCGLLATVDSLRREVADTDDG